MPVPALVLERIRHAYGSVEAVRGVDLAIDEGEVVCLVGPSGCGKSTLLRVAAGLEPLQAGRVTINGTVVADQKTNVPPERRSIGLVFQDFALFPHLNVAQNVGFGLKAMAPSAARAATRAMLAHVGMDAYAGAYPHELSGGQQQRVALARALAPEPQVMLLDEPFSGLDARLRDQVRDESLHLLKASGAATLIVTHDSEEAMFMADRIAVMRDGELVQVGEPAELYFAPKDAFVAEFFSEVNRLAGTVAGGTVATPLGPVASNGHADGTAVEILIRPEGVALTDDPQGPQAEVVAARLLGRTSLIHLAVPDPERPQDEPLHLHARIAGQTALAAGARTGLALNSSLAFVFAARSVK